MEKIPENIKLILGSTLPLVIVIILFAVVGPFGVSKVMDQQTQIGLLENNKTVLSQKLKLLQSISTTVSQNSSAAISALPDANTSLIAVSQIKTIGAQNGVAIAGVKAGSEAIDPSGTSHVGISFQVTGDKSQIIAFLKNVANIAPITLVDRIKITGNGGSEIADITLESYWSSLPKTLPKLTTPINDLTAAENKTLSSVSTLTQPTFSVVPPSDGAGKTDPFTQ